MSGISNRDSVAVTRVYSSHLVIPQTKSPLLKLGCPESITLATPFPVITCVKIKSHGYNNNKKISSLNLFQVQFFTTPAVLTEQNFPIAVDLITMTSSSRFKSPHFQKILQFLLNILVNHSTYNISSLFVHFFPYISSFIFGSMENDLNRFHL